MKNFSLQFPAGGRVPVLISIPHCGTFFPPEVRDDFIPDLIQAPDDTDWFVDRLYAFAPSLGITVISGCWSRWVIDLNRNPDSAPLYSDGRIITGLCPTTTFLGASLYRDRRTNVDPAEIERRKQLYFNPYHEKLSELLTALKEEFGTVLLWDCHSIRQMVPTIQKGSFPDLILGSADRKSADNSLIDAALNTLGNGGYTLQHNDPFKGGFITRHYGRPGQRQHALQLEMSKINYMDDSETLFHPQRAKKMAELLINTLSSLSQTLISLKD